MRRLLLIIVVILFTSVMGICTSVAQAQSNLSDNVDLIWEADTYVPTNFQEVKPLITASSRVRVVAIPNVFGQGSKVSSNNLLFEWTYNGRRLPDHSGYGQDVLSIPSANNRDRINITIKNRSGEVVASDYIVLPQSSVKLNIYGVNPLLGLHKRVLGDRVTSDNTSIELIAIPFYVPKDLHNITWRVGEYVAHGENVVILDDQKELQVVAMFNDLILGDYSNKILVQFK